VLKNNVFCLMGPTASGKTAQAYELVQRFPMEIISIDSAMIYRDMNIGTAKPDAELLARAPHHLIDVLDPPETYSAAQCCEDVNALCQAIFNRGNVPLLVGGTMMYFNALQKGLSLLPEANEAIRQSILQQANEHGLGRMHQELANIDPVSARRINPHDTQRIQRALEVYAITKTPLSVLCDTPKAPSSLQFTNLVIFPESRKELHERIEARFKHMLADGFIQEVEALLNKWSLTASHSSMRSVGYRQIISYLQGEYDYETLYEKATAATRQLAKRQLTWLRSWPEKIVFQPTDASITDDKMMAIVQQLLK
jgi:tRNA dimethylallyltransferase